MNGADLRGIFISFVYVLVVLLATDFARRRFHMPVEATRKIVHVAVGMWVFPTLLLFDHWQWALVPPLVFALLNALSLRFHFFASIEVAEPSAGTVLFPLAFAALLAIFWRIGRPEVAAAGIMAMTWGDAMAAIVGRAWGQAGYNVWGQRKTWLGSLACFSWSMLAIVVTLRLMTNYALQLGMAVQYSPPQALLYAMAVGLAAAVIEAVTPKGWDNLTAPLVSAAVLYLLV